MPITTLLIDLDGTLTDPQIGITTCIRYAMTKMGQPLPYDMDLRWCIGPPLKDSLATLLNTTDAAKAEQALHFYRERFGSIGLFENAVYPDVALTLQHLSMTYQLLVATAKPTIYATQILQHFDLAQYFKQIYGSELDGTRTQKADLIAYILQQHHLLAEQCVMIGDREHDILGARANGMVAIAASYGYGSATELQAAQPLATISQFKDLPQVLAALSGIPMQNNSNN